MKNPALMSIVDINQDGKSLKKLCVFKKTFKNVLNVFITHFLTKKITISRWELNVVVLLALFVGIASTSILTTTTFLFPKIFAAVDPWSQTDWDGGTASGTVTTVVTTYESKSNINATVDGQITLSEAYPHALMKGTQLSGGGTQLNTATPTAMSFNTSQDYNDLVFSYSGGNNTRLTVDESGDYFVSITADLNCSGCSGTYRNGVDLEVRVNGTKKDVGVAASTYIRNASSNDESSGHLAVVLESLSANDYIEIFVSNATSDTASTLTGNIALYAEQIPSSETIFTATGTRTVAGTNLNSSASSMQWTESIKDSGYSHSNSTNSHQVTLDATGNYFVAVNIPLSSSSARPNVTGKILLDGGLVDGGIFEQGYIRNADSHDNASIHWAGVVTTSSTNQVLSITTEQEAASGTVTVGSDKATLFVQKLPATGVYHAEATQAGGSNNWNPSSAANINWATDNIIDSSVYSHSTSTNNHQITVLDDGDYLLAFNLATDGNIARGNVKNTVSVNGTPVTGAETQSSYRRATASSDSGSNSLVYLLNNLSANDIITIDTVQEGASGTFNDATPATLMIWKKGYASSGTLTSNIFDAEFPADWETLTYNSSGSGTVTVKIRSDDNSDMSTATAWGSCTGASSGSTASTNSCVDDTDQYFQYQITLEPGSGDTPVFEDISIDYSSSDDTPPDTNATNIDFSNSLIDDSEWVKTAPTITWTAGADNAGGVGLAGYCISLEEQDEGVSSSDLDPATQGGVLNSLDDGVELSACPYIVTGTSVDLSTVSGLTLTTDKDYYFSIKAVDIAGNIWTGASNEYQNLADFKYDSGNPTNVGFISTPSTNFGSVDDMFFTWPITGGSASSDSVSGVIGWQYSINGTSDYKGPDATSDSTYSFEIDYIEDDSSTSSHYLTTADDGSSIVLGNNTIYFRTVDAAGNYSTPVTGGISYGGAAPTFEGGSVVTVTPSTNTSNSFAFSWPAADANNGGSISSYYYMINNTPPSSLSTLQGNSSLYIPTTSISVSAGTVTGAIKGNNTIYVVAIDDEDNYSPSNYISGSFTLNSTNPDPPQDLLATDASIKSDELWRATLTWSAPAYKGTGNLTYIIERSTNNSSWTEIDRITSRSYTDTVSTSQTYYYRVATIDTSDASKNNPSYATSVSVLPKGTYDEPPSITTDPEVTSITTQKATISWGTSRVADTKVQYGKSSGDYFDEEPSKSEQVTDHEIILTNLDPGTKYYFVAKYTDEDGNTGTSDEITFTTDPAPQVSDVSAINIGISSATLEFTVSDAAKAKVYYGETTSFGGISEISTSADETTYNITLSGLADGTEYKYKINTFDDEDEEYEGTILNFTTLPRPRISGVRVQQVKGTAQPTILVSWQTNTEVSSVVTYYPSSNPAASLDEVNVELVSGLHQMVVRGLLPQTPYTILVSGRDIVGNEAVSEPLTVTTATDTRPPLVENLRIESSIDRTSNPNNPQAQLIVSWDTDEPATSQIEYGQGTGTTYSQRTQEDNNLTFNHLVLISGLTPSNVYHLRVLSKDSAGNLSQSIDNVTITSKAIDNALDLVVGNLQEAFGFIRN